MGDTQHPKRPRSFVREVMVVGGSQPVIMRDSRTEWENTLIASRNIASRVDLKMEQLLLARVRTQANERDTFQSYLLCNLLANAFVVIVTSVGRGTTSHLRSRGPTCRDKQISKTEKSSSHTNRCRNFELFVHLVDNGTCMYADGQNTTRCSLQCHPPIK